MEQFANVVQTTVSEEKITLSIIDYLRKAVSQLLPTNLNALDNILQTLAPETHSLGFLIILHVKVLHENPPNDTLLVLVRQFLCSFCPVQMRAIPDIFAELCHNYTNALVQKRDFDTLITVLSYAIEKFRLNSSQLTSIHADLYQACLLARNFQPALKFLDVDITDIFAETVPVDSKYFLLYYYYGGMIYAALKRFSRALNFFEIVLTTPAQAVSQIMVEAYKKYVLICLLLKGRFQTLPKYTSQVVYRFIRPMCQPYTDLMSVYGTFSTEKFRRALLKHHDLLNRDSNYGLAKQVFASINKRNIQKLTNTFITLSLADVASRCNLESDSEAEKYLVSMIEESEIFATIDKRNGMVFFHDSPENFDSADVLQAISDDLESSLRINREVERLDAELNLVPLYVQKIAKQATTTSWMHEDEGLGVGAGPSTGPEIYPAPV